MQTAPKKSAAHLQIMSGYIPPETLRWLDRCERAGAALTDHEMAEVLAFRARGGK